MTRNPLSNHTSAVIPAKHGPASAGPAQSRDRLRLAPFRMPMTNAVGPVSAPHRSALRRARDDSGWRSATVLAFAALTLSACGVSLGRDAAPERASPSPARTSAAASAAISGVDPTERRFEVGEIPPQTLAPGECGVFLWTKREPPTLVFFSSSTRSGAVMRIDGQVVDLTRRTQPEDFAAQERIVQTFDSARARIAVRLDVARGETIAAGQRIPDGVLRLTDERGWEAVTPVGGLAACDAG